MPQEDIDQAISRLCQSCGFCCSGPLFTRVPLAENDAPLSLSESGLPSRSQPAGSNFRGHADAFMLHYDKEVIRELELPCPFLLNRSCTVYSERPTRCREYECKLIRGIRAGSVSLESADETLLKATELYRRLKEKLGAPESTTGFWLHMRRLVDQSITRIPSLFHRAGFHPNTLKLVEEFLAILDEHFEASANLGD